MPAPSATIDRKAAQELDNREVIYPGDEWLPEPEVYYVPFAPNMRLKVYDDGEIDIRRKRHFQAERVSNGRYVANTVLQRAAIRRVLGHRADLFKGDDMSREESCRGRTCSFSTRNQAAMDAHLQYFDNHDPMPDLDLFYRYGG